MNSSLCLPGVLRDPRPFCPGTTLVASIAQIDPGLRCSFSCHIHGANSKMENEGEEAATSGKFSEATTWHFHFHSISQKEPSHTATPSCKRGLEISSLSGWPCAKINIESLWEKRKMRNNQ